ncbi:SPOR domain-containing protein [Providencia stuartii]|uniref:SPOR domain-containing protein n=1 Tax=Providencia stuartii TaxID=588 RepID=UPI00300C9C91
MPTVEGWSSAPFDVSSDLTSFKPRLVALRAVFTQGVSAVMAHIEPQNRVHETAGEISYDSSLSLGAALGSSEETMPDTPPVNIVNAQNLREYLGYRFVDIGMLLLGQTQETKAAKREAARSVRASARPPGSSPLVSDGSGYLLPGVVCHENALALYQCDWKEEEILLSFSSKAIRSPMGSLPVAPSVPITHHDEVLTTGHGSSDRVTLPNEPRRIVPQHTVDDDKQRGTPHSVRAMGDYQEETLSSNLGGDIRKAAKHHYTLQLSSASTQAPLLALAKKYRLSNYLVYEKHKDGQTWFVLVYGEYRGISQARQALQQLPVEFKKNTPWVRRISHVQSEI